MTGVVTQSVPLGGCGRDCVATALDAFTSRLASVGCTSDDQYDLWATAHFAQLPALQTAPCRLITRIAIGGLRNRMPRHRRAQAFCALARYCEHPTSNG